MKPFRYNMTIWRGSTYRKVFICYSGTTESSPPRDLTGWTGTLLARPARSEIIELAGTASGGMTVDLSGAVDISIDGDLTRLYDWRAANYLVKLTDPGGTVIPLAWGSIQVRGIG